MWVIRWHDAMMCEKRTNQRGNSGAASYFMLDHHCDLMETSRYWSEQNNRMLNVGVVWQSGHMVQCCNQLCNFTTHMHYDWTHCDWGCWCVVIIYHYETVVLKSL